VYVREALERVAWNESIRVSEDVCWLLEIAKLREVRWIRGDEPVGVWLQHRGPRQSFGHAAHEPTRAIAESIVTTMDGLVARGRMTSLRRDAAIAGLWACVHQAFYLRPLYWHRIAKIALALAPGSCP